MKVMDKEMLWSKILRGRTPGEGRGGKKVLRRYFPEFQRFGQGQSGGGGRPPTIWLKGTCRSVAKEDSFSSLSSALVRGRSRSLVCDWGINNGESPLCYVSGPLLHERTARRSLKISVRFDILRESEKQIF